MASGMTHFPLSDIKEFLKKNQERLGLSFDAGMFFLKPFSMSSRQLGEFTHRNEDAL